MNEQRRANMLTVVIGVAAIAAVAAIVAVVLVRADNTTQNAVTTTPSATTSANRAVAASDDRWLQMEQSGELHTMLQQHQAMMQQMQASASPQMLELMRRDPMWQMLESGELIDEMARHQADINRLLAQPGQ